MYFASISGAKNIVRYFYAGDIFTSGIRSV